MSEQHEGAPGLTIVVGSFDKLDRAETAIDALRAAGYDRRQIGFIRPQGEGRTVLVEEHGRSTGNGIAGGAVTGAVAGGAMAWLGLMALPAVGPVVAGGALGTALIGASTGAVTGGVLGGLLGLGIPRHRAAYHEEQLRTGYCLVTVQTGEPGSTERILRGAGATQVDAGEPPYTPKEPATSEEPVAIAIEPARGDVLAAPDEESVERDPVAAAEERSLPRS